MQARAAVQMFWMHAWPAAHSLSARHCVGVLRTHCPLVHTAPIGQSLSTIHALTALHWPATHARPGPQSLSTMHAPGLLRTHCPLAPHVEPGGHGTIGPHCGPVVALH